MRLSNAHSPGSALRANKAVASWHYGPGASLLVGGFGPLVLLPSTKSKIHEPSGSEDRED